MRKPQTWFPPSNEKQSNLIFDNSQDWVSNRFGPLIISISKVFPLIQKKLCQIFSDKIVLHFWLQLIFQKCSYTNWNKKHISNTHWIVLIFSNLKISLNFIRRLTSITQAIFCSRFFDTKTFFRCNQCGFVDLN